MYDLYQCNADDTARFILGKNGARKLFAVGLNPSTANRENSDTTVAKVESVANNNNFNGFVMCNLYPLRSTDPNGLPQNEDEKLRKINQHQVINLAKDVQNPVFWAAWGNNITMRRYLPQALHALSLEVQAIEGKWLHFGKLTKSGHPRHPSRLSYSWRFSGFDIVNYLRNIT